MNKRTSWKNIIESRRGASTLEYVIIIAAGILLASLLLFTFSSDESIGDTLQSKVIGMITGKSNTIPTSDPKDKSPIEEPVNTSNKIASADQTPPPSIEKPHEEKGWLDKAKEIPVLGYVVKKTEPYYKEYIEPNYNKYVKPWGGPVVEEVLNFFDPTSGIYELATGKDWDTGEKISGYERFGEPFLNYLLAKKVGKVGGILSKVDKKLLGGKVTKWVGDKILKPIDKKRDEFVDWACGKPKKTALLIDTAYADTGKSVGNDGSCLIGDILGDENEKKNKGKDKNTNHAGGYKGKYNADKKHVHEGETVNDPQSPYNGKWNGEGLHNWKKLKSRVEKDGYEFNKVEMDENGVLYVEVRRIGHDPATLKKYENIKAALETVQSGTASKSQQKKAQKVLQKYKVDPNTDPNTIDPKALSKQEKVTTKTVYPSHYTEQQIDEMGDKALDQFLKNNNLQYSTLPNGDVKPIRFNSVVKGPDGKDIEVEGYVVPKPDGSVDHINTHYPKFTQGSNNKTVDPNTI
ncbi:putative toxin of predicted polymorphic toxin system [Laceyella sacchari]|uniref:pre-toxin TG domain-containing protein n=1 Tax=Laceyella sacchari TaxID=37482 RepID=UPI0010445509|nr:hypothetical protein [Laceyella sacchari]TCW36630.1 putative toxin of predicted polymorphic toxin system [Laceyella sacchari]